MYRAKVESLPSLERLKATNRFSTKSLERTGTNATSLFKLFKGAKVVYKLVVYIRSRMPNKDMEKAMKVVLEENNRAIDLNVFASFHREF